jgi:hypothetical protein
MDGFEGFTDSGGKSVLDPVYDYFASTNATEVGVFSPGRTGGKAIFNDESSDAAGNAEMHHITISTVDPTIIVGCAVKINYPITFGNQLIKLYDSSASGQITLLHQAGAFRVMRGNMGDAVLGYADAGMPTNNWFFLELKVFFHDTTGTVTLRINEKEVMTLTGQDTIKAVAGDNYSTQVGFGGSNSDARCEIDDLYICDGAGSINNDFLGDGAIRRLDPIGEPAVWVNTFTGSDGNSVQNHALVVESNPDDDGSYVTSDGTGHKDLYDVSNMSSTPTSIAAMSLVSYGYHTPSAGPGHVVNSSGSEQSDPTINPAGTYGHVYSVFETDPNTSAAWGEAGINAVEIGVETVP